MYIVKINGSDKSRHTQEVDALAQKVAYEAQGASNVTIEEKETFSPNQ